VRAIRRDDLKRLGVPPQTAMPFIVLPDYRPRDDAIEVMRGATAHKSPESVRQLELYA